MNLRTPVVRLQLAALGHRRTLVIDDLPTPFTLRQIVARRVACSAPCGVYVTK